MKYWEYKQVEAWMDEDQLNILGNEGWELVSHVHVSPIGFMFYTFKREKISVQKEST